MRLAKGLKAFFLWSILLPGAPAFASDWSLRAGFPVVFDDLVSSSTPPQALLFGFDPSLALTYTAKSGKTVWRWSLGIDNDMVVPTTGSALPYLQSLRVNPNVELSVEGWHFVVGLPSFANGDRWGADAMASKGLAYWARSAAYNQSPWVFVAQTDHVSYQMRLGSQWQIMAGAEVEFLLVPVFAWADVKPRLDLVVGPVSVSTRFSAYFTPDDPSRLDQSASILAPDRTGKTYCYLDPRVILDTKILGFPGSRVWVAASIPVTTGALKNLTGLWVQPGIAGQIGPWGWEATFRLSGLDVASTATTGFSFNPAVGVSYLFSL